LAQKQTNKFNAKEANNFPVPKNTNTNSESLQGMILGALWDKWAWLGNSGKPKRQMPVSRIAAQFIIIVLYKQQMRENRAGSRIEVITKHCPLFFFCYNNGIVALR